MDGHDQVLTAEQVAELIQLNVEYVRKLSREGTLPADRLPSGRALASRGRGEPAGELSSLGFVHTRPYERIRVLADCRSASASPAEIVISFVEGEGAPGWLDRYVLSAGAVVRASEPSASSSRRGLGVAGVEGRARKQYPAAPAPGSLPERSLPEGRWLACYPKQFDTGQSWGYKET